MPSVPVYSNTREQLVDGQDSKYIPTLTVPALDGMATFTLNVREAHVVPHDFFVYPPDEEERK
jgi:hypothetical protein